MSNHSGSAPTWITCTYLEKMLQNSLKDDSIRVHDYNIGPGSSVGDNYACQIFRIKCNCTKKNQSESISIIAKAVPKTEISEELNKDFDLFETEIKMLGETLPLLYKEICTKLESKPFFPNFYKMDRENKIFFVEDLKADGYVLADRKLSQDFNHASLVIEALAKLHASSYIYLKKNPEHKNKYLDHFFKRSEGSFMEKMLVGTRDYFLKGLPLWPISEEDKKIFEKLNFYDLMVDSYQRKESSFNAVIHGDCWTNNMMFKYENGKVVSVKLFDFQLSNYNSIGLDLNYFLFTSASEDVKLNHLEDVFKLYYDTFVGITGEIDGFSLDTVRKEFIERLGFGFCVGLMFRPGMLAEAPFDLDAYYEDRESESNAKMYQNKAFISEGVKLLHLFKKYGVFK